jgi:hypothetical protein
MRLVFYPGDTAKNVIGSGETAAVFVPASNSLNLFSLSDRAQRLRQLRRFPRFTTSPLVFSASRGSSIEKAPTTASCPK